MPNTDARTGLENPLLSDAPADITVAVGHVVSRLSVVMAMFDQGARSSQPSAGHAGKIYRVSNEGRSIGGVQQGVFEFDNGSNWVRMEPWVRPLTSLLSLPSGYTPVDDDEALLTFQFAGSGTLQNYAWRLRYAAANAVRKWRAMACAPLISSYFMGSAGAGPVISPSAGVAGVRVVFGGLVLPAPGFYLIRCKAYCVVTGTGAITAWLSPALRDAATSAVQRNQLQFNDGSAPLAFSGAGASIICEVPVVVTSPTTAVDLWAGFSSGASMTMTVNNVVMEAIPLELGT